MATVHGFSLHANTAVPSSDRDGLERLARNGARGPMAEERLRRLAPNDRPAGFPLRVSFAPHARVPRLTRMLAEGLRHQRGAVITLLVLSLVNIVLGVWRPRLELKITRRFTRHSFPCREACDVQICPERSVQATSRVFSLPEGLQAPVAG
jgi:hypothetical protein